MRKKLFSLTLIFCFLFLPHMAKSKEYSHSHVFFDENFWKNATLDDVKRNIIKSRDINTQNIRVSSVDTLPLKGVPILAYAIYWGAKSQIAQYLIDNGAEVTGDALRQAKSLEMLKLLVKNGGDVNGLSRDDSTPLHQAYTMSAPMVEYLLEQGAVPDIRNHNGDTPLSLLYDKTEDKTKDWKSKISLLENAGAKIGKSQTPKEASIIQYTIVPNTADTYTYKHNFYNPYFWRVATKKDVEKNKIPGEFPPEGEFVENVFSIALRHVTDVDILDLLPQDAPRQEWLYAVAQNKNPDMVRFVLKYLPDTLPDQKNLYPQVAAAAAAGLQDNVILFLKHDPFSRYNEHDGSDIVDNYRIQPTKGRPERAAIIQKIKDMPQEYGEHSALFSIWSTTTVADIKDFVRDGYDLNTRYRWNLTVETLHYFDKTILEIAIYRHASPEVIEFLVKNGAVITKTALNAADKKTKETLLKLGGDARAHFTIRPNKEKTYNFYHNYNIPEFWEKATLDNVKESFIEGETLNPHLYGSYSLALAVENTKNPAIIRFLLEKGAQINDEAMVNAARNKNIAFLKILVDHGGDLHANAYFDVPLTAAITAELKEHVIYLLKKGADVNTGDFEIGTPLYVALGCEQTPTIKQIVKILKDAGGKKYHE